MFDREDDDFMEFENYHNGDDDRMEVVRKAQRLMFINDLEKYPTQPMPLGVDEFEHLFGKPTGEDKDIMTQAFIKDYLRINPQDEEGYGQLCAKWGLDWLQLFLNHNVEREEYELCSIFKEVYDGGSSILKKWMVDANS